MLTIAGGSTSARDFCDGVSRRDFLRIGTLTAMGTAGGWALPDLLRAESLSSRKTPPFDLGQLRSQGIVPEKLFAIGVKAAVAHRRAYDPIAQGSYTVATPGPCSSVLGTFPYRRLRRPVFPLDPI